MVRFDMKKGSYVRMKLVEKMIDHMDIPSSIIPKVGKLNWTTPSYLTIVCKTICQKPWRSDRHLYQQAYRYVKRNYIIKGAQAWDFRSRFPNKHHLIL